MTTTTKPSTAATPARGVRNRGATKVTAALIGGGWVLAVLAGLTGVQWLLPALVWLTLASLLRGGRTLLDRLMLALALLVGMVPAAGLLFSVWPFGLSTIAIAGTAFTVLGLVHAATGRRPQLPRPGWQDLPAPVAGAVAALAAGLPVTGMDRLHIVGRFMMGEDSVRHFTAFDTISRLGSYLYLEGERADVPMSMVWYPQGWHLTSALLDGFAGPAAGGLDAFASAERYFLAITLTFGLLITALIWSASWLGGRFITLPRLLILTGGLLGFGLYFELSPLFLTGYVAEIFALAQISMLIALTCRPVRSFRQQTLLVGALVAGVGLSYFLYLPLAGLTALAWLARNRRQARQHLKTVVAVGIPVALVAPLPAIVIATRNPVVQSAINWAGGAHQVNIPAIAALTICVVGGLLSPWGRRSPVWRAYRVVLLLAVGLLACLYLYQMLTIGQTSYYFQKLLHVTVLTGLAGAALAFFIWPLPKPFDWRRTVLRFAPLTALALSLALLIVAVPDVRRSREVKDPIELVRTLPRNLAKAGMPGDSMHQEADFLLAANELYPATPGRPNVVIGEDFFAGYLFTLQLSMMQRTLGSAPVCGPPDLTDPVEVDKALKACPTPVRMIAATQVAAEQIRKFQRANPELDVELAIVAGKEARH